MFKFSSHRLYSCFFLWYPIKKPCYALNVKESFGSAHEILVQFALCKVNMHAQFSSETRN